MHSSPRRKENVRAKDDERHTPWGRVDDRGDDGLLLVVVREPRIFKRERFNVCRSRATQVSSILSGREEKPRLVVAQCNCLLTPSPRHTVDLEAHVDEISGPPELELRVDAQNDVLELGDMHYAFVPNILPFEVA